MHPISSVPFGDIAILFALGCPTTVAMECMALAPSAVLGDFVEPLPLSDMCLSRMLMGREAKER